MTRITVDLGEGTVAAFGMGARVESLAMIGPMALSAVIIPFIRKNFGAKYFDRIKDASRFLLLFALVWVGTAWALCLSFQEELPGPLQTILKFKV